MNFIPGWPLQAAEPQPGIDMSFYLMLAGVGLVWFFLVIRPQNQRQKDHEASLKSAEKGDQVITSGGIRGKIVSVGDDDFSVEIASLKGGGSVKVQIVKSRIESVSKPGDVAKAKQDKEAKGGK